MERLNPRITIAQAFIWNHRPTWRIRRVSRATSPSQLCGMLSTLWASGVWPNVISVTAITVCLHHVITENRRANEVCQRRGYNRIWNSSSSLHNLWLRTIAVNTSIILDYIFTFKILILYLYILFAYFAVMCLINYFSLPIIRIKPLPT
jgi:hypothetical protein